MGTNLKEQLKTTKKCKISTNKTQSGKSTNKCKLNSLSKFKILKKPPAEIIQRLSKNLFLFRKSNV